MSKQPKVEYSLALLCIQMMVYNLDTKPFWKSEVDDIDTVEDISKKLPWFLECNPDRFPYWWVEHSCDNILSLLFTFHFISNHNTFAGLGNLIQGTAN